jgi:hypothetical protein
MSVNVLCAAVLVAVVAAIQVTWPSDFVFGMTVGITFWLGIQRGRYQQREDFKRAWRVV